MFVSSVSVKNRGGELGEFHLWMKLTEIVVNCNSLSFRARQDDSARWNRCVVSGVSEARSASFCRGSMVLKW